MDLIDLVLLGTYFGLMGVLSLFGLHRYTLVYLYYRHRRNELRPPQKQFSSLPRVTIQLPIYNERFVVEDLLDSICALRYPRQLLQIQVLDDSDDETKPILERAVARKRAAGEPVEYIHRATRQGYKAGALQYGLRRATGELIAVFDADFAPRPDFLEQVVHYFTDQSVGMVQARWTYRNRNASILTRLQAMLLDGHFVFEHGSRARSGRFFNFNGTAGVLRKAAIDDAGGWQQDTLTEDTDLSYRAQLKGWKFLYAPQIESPSELPADMASFQVQQYRWAKGLIQTGIKLLPRILRAKLPFAVKAEAVFHLTGNVAYPLMLLMALLVLPAILSRYSHLDGRLLWLDLPAFLMTFCSLASFYALAQRELGRGGIHRHLHLVPLLVAAGIGLALNNSRAAASAILGFRSPFERTAKYSAEPGAARRAQQVYGRRGGWRVALNLLAASYFAICLAITLHIGHWMGLPVVLLFLGGFAYAATAMLTHSKSVRLLAAPDNPAP